MAAGWGSDVGGVGGIGIQEMTKTTKQYLLEVRRALQAPENWTQGMIANGQGARCLWGAILKTVHPWLSYIEVKKALYSCLPAGTAENLVAFNDDASRTHSEILALLDAAIAAQGGTE